MKTILLLLLIVSTVYAQHDSTKCKKELGEKWTKGYSSKLSPVPEGCYNDKTLDDANKIYTRLNCGQTNYVEIYDTLGTAIYSKVSTWKNGVCTDKDEYGKLVNGRYVSISFTEYKDLTKGNKDIIYRIDRHYPAPRDRKKDKIAKKIYGWFEENTARWADGTAIKFHKDDICICGHHFKTVIDPCCGNEK